MLCSSSWICPFKAKKSSLLFGIFSPLARAMISDMIKGFRASEGWLKKQPLLVIDYCVCVTPNDTVWRMKYLFSIFQSSLSNPWWHWVFLADFDYSAPRLLFRVWVCFTPRERTQLMNSPTRAPWASHGIWKPLESWAISLCIHLK